MNPRLPLNEPQERHLSIILADLERAVLELQRSVAAPPTNALLTEYEEPVDQTLAQPLGRRIAQVEALVGRMAQDLDLPKSRHSILRKHLAALQLLSIDLGATLPSAGLRGYGEVAPGHGALSGRCDSKVGEVGGRDCLLAGAWEMNRGLWFK